MPSCGISNSSVTGSHHLLRQIQANGGSAALLSSWNTVLRSRDVSILALPKIRSFNYYYEVVVLWRLQVAKRSSVAQTLTCLLQINMACHHYLTIMNLFKQRCVTFTFSGPALSPRFQRATKSNLLHRKVNMARGFSTMERAILEDALLQKQRRNFERVCRECAGHEAG